MEIKSFNKLVILFLMLMLLGVSSKKNKSTKCVLRCVRSCAEVQTPSCFSDCLEECQATLPNPAPINRCDLTCVTETCLDPNTDAKAAKACVKECSDICKKS
ncbi:hypothetical protein BT93_B1541 [Corymbia citriodora subsp. variegata]|nr:hypothetical protein BT93_B1541 [Corymbia citriodora subsp. variegata]